ncbi:TenA family protein [Mobilicoccus caccae]|uniref:Aminopyrimidine aminohydrolase n=1 Tax=Mobilicoccus caccae TaxID=1859295 RepID=A0ABQ6INA2_9MICO|nr:TenA family protein [Mobilicoccus caccae]GMA38189.1 aminopyrimidine aminohydrolase [Mobilicoccus caccae]
MTSFTQTAWTHIEGIRAGIDALPFVTELADGTLDRARFDHYMAQDALYLFEYGRTLAACATQSSTSDDLIFWAAAARETIVVERVLHEAHVGDMTATEPSPTCVAYTGFLSSLVAGGCYPVLAAGVLPCFWIYKDVGDRLLEAAGDLEQHAYGDWIATYADEDFAESTRQAIAIVDRLADESSPQVRERMLAAFGRAAQFEWMFWDAAHRRETWPIA